MQAIVRLSHNDGYIALPHYGKIGEKFFSQKYNDKLFSSRAKQRLDNHAVPNLQSYPLSCTANTRWYFIGKTYKASVTKVYHTSLINLHLR